MRVASPARPALHRFRTSLLRVPAAYVAAAALTSLALVPLEWAVEGTPITSIADVGRAQDLLPAIGSATLTLAGFVLTMATLSIQFGASTYAPRLVERLRRDAVLQHTIGVALGTFVFSFLVLLVVGPSHQASAAAAVGISLVGAAATVLLFVALLDRLTGALRPGATLRAIAERAAELIPDVYPERDGRELEGDVPGDDRLPDHCRVVWDHLPSAGVVWRSGGFGTLVDARFAQLVEVASERDARVELMLPVGAFIADREAIAVVRGADGDPSDELSLALEGTICDALIVSHERTVDADPAYAIRLLVDIALRALSPGVNDPTTAAQAIDHLGPLMVQLASRRLGPRALEDDGGIVRVLVPAPGWSPLVDLAFDELVEVATTARVRRHLLVVIEDIEGRVAVDRRPPLRQRADALGGPTRPTGAG